MTDIELMMPVAYGGVLAALGDMAGLRGQCLTRLLMPYCFTFFICAPISLRNYAGVRIAAVLASASVV